MRFTASFMLIVFIIIFTYGISTQALMFHNQDGSFEQILGNIFLPSFFILSGNDGMFENYLSCTYTWAVQDNFNCLLNLEAYIIYLFLRLKVGKCNVTDSRELTDQYVNDYVDDNVCPDAVGSKVTICIYIFMVIALNILLINLLIAVYK